MSLKCLPPSFGSIWLTILEQMRFEYFQDGHLWGHLRWYATRTISEILNLYVALMPPIKFGQSELRFRRRYRSKNFKMAVVVVSLDVGIEKISSSESPCLPNASHLVSALSDLPFESRCHFKIFKLATMAAILDLKRNKFSISKSPCHPNASYHVWAQSDLPFGSRPDLKILRWPLWRPSWKLEQNDFSNSESLFVPMPPIKFQLNPTYGFGGDVVWRIQDSHRGRHLGYRNETILAILNLCPTVKPTIKFGLNPTYSLGDVVGKI